MILPRDEFSRRWTDREFDVDTKVTKLVDTAMLIKEIKVDAEYRSHKYMFDGSDFDKIPLQETTVGILNTQPDIKTEGDRFRAIEKEILADTYKPVEIFQDIEHKSVVYVNDGFHRIFLANKLGIKRIRCEVKIGTFILSNSIRIRDMTKHLDILAALTGSKELKTFAKKLDKKVDTVYDSSVKLGDVLI